MIYGIMVDPVIAIKNLDYDLYGIESTAINLQKFMYYNKTQQNVA